MTGSDSDRLFNLVCGEGGQPVVDPFDRVTAAVISKPRLLLVTVDAAGTGVAAVNQRKSQSFELADRSASALQSFKASVERFVTRARINRVFLRMSADGGTYAAHPWNYKIEAALQLIDGLTVTLISPHSIGAWVRRDAPDLPPLEALVPGARWRDAQARCLETALFAGLHGSTARYFTDGSKPHG